MGSTSVDLAIRCFSPPMIARAYQLATTGLGTANERLGRQFALIETILHTTVAVLANDALRLEPEPNEVLCKFVNKLKTPALGDWLATADALSVQILKSRGEPVAPEYSALYRFRSRPEAGPKPTAFNIALGQLVALRNRIVHSYDGRITLQEEQAEAHLRRTIYPRLREILDGLRAVVDRPICVLLERGRVEGGFRPRFVRLRGTEAEVLCFESVAIDIPVKVPFVLSEGGDVLLLSPWVRFGSFHGAAETIEVLWRLGNRGARFQGQPTEVLNEADNDQLKRKLLTPRERLDRALPEAVRIQLQALALDRPDADVPGWVIRGQLGYGASSDVFLAENAATNRSAALKVMREAVALHSRQRQRFEKEAKLLGELEHPGIVRVVDRVKSRNGLPCIVLDLVEGTNLKSYVNEGGPLTLKELGPLVEKVLEALAAAHAKGIIHRDIKPSNIMIDRKGRPVLIDFGIARDSEQTSQLTGTLDAVGTKCYAAPEQLEGKSVDARADLFALARTVEFLLAGDSPESSWMKEQPPGLVAFLRRAGHKDARARYADASEMLEAWRQRRAGKWGGAPLEVGDHLVENFVVDGVRERQSGFWFFLGHQRHGGQPVEILVPAASDTVSDLQERMSPDHRHRLQIIMTTPDGLEFAVLRPEEEGQEVTIETLLLKENPGSLLLTLRKALDDDALVPEALQTVSLGVRPAPSGSSKAFLVWAREAMRRLYRLANGIAAETCGEPSTVLGSLYKPADFDIDHLYDNCLLTTWRQAGSCLRALEEGLVEILELAFDLEFSADSESRRMTVIPPFKIMDRVSALAQAICVEYDETRDQRERAGRRFGFRVLDDQFAERIRLLTWSSARVSFVYTEMMTPSLEERPLPSDTEFAIVTATDPSELPNEDDPAYERALEQISRVAARESAGWSVVALPDADPDEWSAVLRFGFRYADETEQPFLEIAATISVPNRLRLARSIWDSESFSIRSRWGWDHAQKLGDDFVNVERDDIELEGFRRIRAVRGVPETPAQYCGELLSGQFLKSMNRRERLLVLEADSIPVDQFFVRGDRTGQLSLMKPTLLGTDADVFEEDRARAVHGIVAAWRAVPEDDEHLFSSKWQVSSLAMRLWTLRNVLRSRDARTESQDLAPLSEGLEACRLFGEWDDRLALRSGARQGLDESEEVLAVIGRIRNVRIWPIEDREAAEDLESLIEKALARCQDDRSHPGSFDRRTVVFRNRPLLLDSAGRPQPLSRFGAPDLRGSSRACLVCRQAIAEPAAWQRLCEDCQVVLRSWSEHRRVFARLTQILGASSSLGEALSSAFFGGRLDGTADFRAGRFSIRIVAKRGARRVEALSVSRSGTIELLADPVLPSSLSSLTDPAEVFEDGEGSCELNWRTRSTGLRYLCLSAGQEESGPSFEAFRQVIARWAASLVDDDDGQPRHRRAIAALKVRSIAFLTHLVECCGDDPPDDLAEAFAGMAGDFREFFRLHFGDFTPVAADDGAGSHAFEEAGTGARISVSLGRDSEERLMLELSSALDGPQTDADLDALVSRLEASWSRIAEAEESTTLAGLRWTYPASTMTGYALYHMLLVDVEALVDWLRTISARRSVVPCRTGFSVYRILT